MPFTLCLNTSTIRPVPLLDKIRIAREAGYAGVELWLDDIYEHVGRGGEVSDIEKALSDTGLIVPCTIALKGWGNASKDDYPHVLEDCRRRLELAARIGSPWVVATPPREPCDRERLIERFRELLELGRLAGALPTFEYISFFRSIVGLADAWSFVEECEDDDATIILDAFHSYNTKSSLDDLRKIPGSEVSHYHVDDADPVIPAGEQLDPDRVMPGDGAIDLGAEVAVLREIGYEGTVSLELFNAAYWKEDPLAVARLGRERLEAIFAG